MLSAIGLREFVYRLVQGFMQPLSVTAVFNKDWVFSYIVTPIGAPMVGAKRKFSKLTLLLCIGLSNAHTHTSTDAIFACTNSGDYALV